jgi:hypothetical protein
MDIFFFVFGTFAIIVSFSAFMATMGLPYGKDLMKFSVRVLLVSILVFIWTVIASINYNPTPIVHHIPIDVKYNMPFFKTPGETIKVLEGDQKFVDVDKNEIVWTTKPGGWSFGIYITETNNWKVSPKVVEK